MTELLSGDRVRIGSTSTMYDGMTGVVLREVAGRKHPFDVDLGSVIGVRYFSPEELELIGPTYVNTSEVRLVWLTLPGADRSYALSDEQARELLRQLEEVV